MLECEGGGAFAALLLCLGCGQAASRPGGFFDAGAVLTSKTKSVTHVFRVVNSTNVPVRLLDESHTCLCTQVEFNKGILLEPGAETPLTIKVDVRPAHREQSVECTIQTDHPTIQDWTYRIDLRAYPDAAVLPAQVDLGVRDATPRDTVADQVTPTAHVEVFGDLADTESPPLSLGSHEGLAASLGAPSSRRKTKDGIPSALVPLFVSVRDGLEPGDYSRHVQVMAGGRQIASLLVTWRVRGRAKVMPTRLSFGVVKANDAAQPLTCTIESDDGTQFSLLSVDSSDPAFIASMSKSTSDSKQELTVQILKQDCSRTKALSAHLTVRTDLQGAESIQVPVSAFVVPKVVR